mmetsp:Transcript_34704/g.79161  ORF Transcript_34704/g.79161 Transcript_34704/m.79161 type:complete len:220 (+) Transcript_34704:2-661(+)
MKAVSLLTRGSALLPAAKSMCRAPLALAPRALAMPRLSRNFSTAESLPDYAVPHMTKLNAITKKILTEEWSEISASTWETSADTLASLRAFVNGLSEGDKIKCITLVEALEKAEETFALAVESYEFHEKVVDLRSLISDLLSADGNVKGTPIPTHLQERFAQTLEEYTGLLDHVPAHCRHKFERDIGHQILLLKQMVHVESFRYNYPRVHPSGFSATAD